jgi:flagellar motor switch protein FliG
VIEFELKHQQVVVLEKQSNPEKIVKLIVNEYLQTIALILSQLKDNSLMGKILEGLPEKLRIDVICRISEIGSIPLGVISEIATALQEGLAYLEASESQVDRIETLVSALQSIDQNLTEKILSEIEEQKTTLSEKIRKILKNLPT